MDNVVSLCLDKKSFPYSSQELNVKMAVRGSNPPLDVAKQEHFISSIRASYCQILLMKRPTHLKQKSRG